MRELFDLEQAISDWRARMTAGGLRMRPSSTNSKAICARRCAAASRQARRRSRRWTQETQALLALGASLVVGFAWFGMLLIGRSAPLGSWWPMEVFAAFHVFLFAIGFARRQKAAVS
jgi:hypothetical protein